METLLKYYSIKDYSLYKKFTLQFIDKNIIQNVKNPGLGFKMFHIMLLKITTCLINLANHILDFCPVNTIVQLVPDCPGATQNRKS